LAKHAWSRQTAEHALRLGVEIASYARAAESFTALTGVGMSKSSLQRLVGEYGRGVVRAQAAEARSMVEVPKHEEEVMWREAVQPESEVMSVSSDGVLIHLREEGWKEVKTMSVSAVTSEVNPESGEREVALTQHSCRAGLWDAATFTQHHWAEACRRGVDQARTVVCVSDGAAWIWAMVFQCFATRIEILDWWHALQRLWTIAQHHFATATAATAWVETQQAALAQSRLRHIVQQVRALYPRGQPLPDPIRQAVAYLFHNRRRIDYAAFRQAGYPIGSGAIESACKVVVQQRIKQAGMRWSREDAQAMLALRCLLLSQRWHELHTLAPPP
jgi:hypothetical protein